MSSVRANRALFPLKAPMAPMAPMGPWVGMNWAPLAVTGFASCTACGTRTAAA